MKVTPRGYLVLSIIGMAIVLGLLHGSRALNAIVAPLVVAGIAAVVIVWRAEDPTIDRRPIEAGHVGDERTVSFVVESGRGTVATVVDAVDDGLTTDENGFEVVLSGETELAYSIRLDERGERTVGPTTVAIRDLLGLVERHVTCPETEPVLVYPPVYELTPTARRELTSIANTAREFDRAEFDRLREYQHGDSLRDVHWKSAAKRPGDQLIVKEFVADAGLDRVSLVAECRSGYGDEMATAAATLVDHLLEADIGVVLTVPYDRTTQGGADHRHELLATTATADEGTAGRDHSDNADILVHTVEDAVVVTVGDRTVPFEELCAYEETDDDRPAVGDTGGLFDEGITPQEAVS